MQDPEFPEFRQFHNWAYPSAPTASLAEIEATFPNALTWFDWACPVFAQGAHGPMRFVIVKGALRVSVNCGSGRNTLQSPAWDPKLQIWRRYSRGVSSYPRQDAQSYEGERGAWFSIDFERARTVAGETRCEGCNEIVDLETCRCGSDENAHLMYIGHSFTPIGCRCRERAAELGDRNALETF